MRRFALVFSVLVLVGALAAGAAAPALASTDWAVNGQPLAPGQEVPVKFATIAPVEFTTPATGIDFTCASWKAKGTLVGGETGTGELVNSKLGRCVDANSIRVKVQITKLKLHTDLFRPVGSPATTEFEIIGICFKKGLCEPPVEIKGTVDGLGPNPGEGNLVDFPQPALPASALTIGGSPGELVTKAVFKLPKHATLSQVEP
jgi:hypothetical protein